ncbi:DDB1- and CUL4-associated factor 13, partial [Microtus ochrogaster]
PAATRRSHVTGRGPRKAEVAWLPEGWQNPNPARGSWGPRLRAAKMKVKMLSRNPDNYVRETKLDIQRVPRNYDPTLHPFEVPREYVRALNATKLERVFAKPFLASLDGHRDGVNCLAKHPKSLTTVLSGACDGEVGDDKTVKQWKMDGPGCGEEEEPLQTILGKVILDMRTNTICWNPMEAFHFTAANEDYNLYTFDMRALDTPVQVHMDHVSAVLDVDYSPTGKEFVSASFDKSIRIFPVERSRSREVYHTKRMQHVICVKWTSDSKYIMCGSDEMNIRLWKAKASEKLGVLSSREKAANDYNQKLKEKFQYHPHVKRIARHRHLPKSIYSQIQEQRIMRESRRRNFSLAVSHALALPLLAAEPNNHTDASRAISLSTDVPWNSGHTCEASGPLTAL